MEPSFCNKYQTIGNNCNALKVQMEKPEPNKLVWKAKEKGKEGKGKGIVDKEKNVAATGVGMQIEKGKR